jgi:hypothetical protein
MQSLDAYPFWAEGVKSYLSRGFCLEQWLSQVNDYTNNQATIHTNPGCSLATTNTASLSISGTLVSSTDCSAADTGKSIRSVFRVELRQVHHLQRQPRMRCKSSFEHLLWTRYFAPCVHLFGSQLTGCNLGFNANGGGVYASEYKQVPTPGRSLTCFQVQWDTSGIAVYFFPRGSIPADITAGAPVPSNWGLAMARWPATSCDPFKFFYNNIAIFDTTLW